MFFFLLVPLVAVFAEALHKGWSAYLAAITEPDALSAIKLTLIATVIAVPLNLVFGVSAAWAITKHDFRGKQLLITRGALTTFSIANDVAKYFAIIPAMFVAFYPQLGALNIMGLSTPQSAILSAIVFNALIIIALIPLALKGVSYRAVGAAALLRRNLLVYGLGGIVVPFVGIKMIDLAVSAMHLV